MAVIRLTDGGLLVWSPVALTDELRTAVDALQRILAWPAEKVLMAHAGPVLADGQAFIRRAFRWLGVQALEPGA